MLICHSFPIGICRRTPRRGPRELFEEVCSLFPPRCCSRTLCSESLCLALPFPLPALELAPLTFSLRGASRKKQNNAAAARTAAAAATTAATAATTKQGRQQAARFYRGRCGRTDGPTSRAMVNARFYPTGNGRTHGSTPRAMVERTVLPREMR